MPVKKITLGLAVVLLAACSTNSVDRPVSPGGEARLAGFNDPSAVDTGQGRLPDLVVDQQTTQNNWLVRVEDFLASFCSVQEGGVNPGTHTVIRFTVTTPNIGAADNFIGNPIEHFNANDGLYEFASCHNHFHFRNYTLYELVDPATGKVWKTAKRGFCMLDTDPAPAWYGQPPTEPLYGSCGTLSRAGFQGISHGWADTYVWQLAGQYFVLDGGDNQEPVPPGTYQIRITVNPAFAPPKKGGCARATDTNGDCRQFPESDYSNNVAVVTIVIPDHPGRDGYGPLKGAAFTGERIDHADKP